MGTWGAGAFENDTAADWAYGLEDGQASSHVEQAIDRITKSTTSDPLDLDDCLEGLAAAEVVAAASGKPSPKLPPAIRHWVAQKIFPPNAALIKNAGLAVGRISSDSELQAEWADDPHWTGEMQDLLARLNGALVAPLRTNTSKTPARPAKTKAAAEESTIHAAMRKLGHRMAWNQMNQRAEPREARPNAVLKDKDLVLLAQISSLRGLALSEARFTTQGMRPLLALKLEWLNLEASSVTDDAGPILAQFNGLASLSLAETKISDLILEHVAKLAHLVTLDLSSTAIDDEGLQHLSSLTNLRELLLGQTRVTGTRLGHLRPSRQLSKLALYDTPLDDSAAKWLPQFRQLRWLSLENTRLTDAGLGLLSTMESLVELRLTGTKTTPAAVDRLQQQLPGTKIVS